LRLLLAYRTPSQASFLRIKRASHRQTLGYFNIVVRGVGLEPSPLRRVSPLSRFFAASFPLFSLFRGRFVFAEAGLAGDELYESGKGSQVPTVRQSESVERRDPVHIFGRVAALLVSKLCLSVLPLVTISYIFPLFLFLGWVIF
jgi:hypothetical protein